MKLLHLQEKTESLMGLELGAPLSIGTPSFSHSESHNEYDKN